MTYRIRGLDPALFAEHFALDDASLARRRARREVAGEGRFPCRVSLEDAQPGEALLLTHYANHAVESPYRNAFAIYVRAAAREAADYLDSLPPVLRGRPIALRGYTGEGDLHSAALALADDVDAQLRALLDDPAVAYIDAHNAMHGCFAARIERH
ncbi:DUF1203 domain-containing protein [Erythrobacter oryzae]|uniref:DUF1203 domain-containing protein n=1 Tax=Erythrobacter oryzae TaxID=3019556 RepID=UPI002555325B|nr:DUF1203 domain-containing protein [Erythrobacter sp. COR-2]